MHSRIAPSAAPQRIFCPGSTQMQERYPQLETQDTREGSASHEAGFIKITTGKMPFIGEKASNGIIFSKQMLDCAEQYADDVLITAAERDVTYGNSFFFAEQKIAARECIHPESWGTPDAAIFFPDDDDLFIWDYKYGHRKIDALENRQCIEYAAGMLEFLKVFGYDGFKKNINIWINVVQPREYSTDGPIRRWFIKSLDLLQYIKIAKAAANNALSKNPICISGPWCRDCTARHSCDAAHNAATASVDYAGEMLADELSLVSLGKELALMERAEQAIKARKTGLSSRVESLLRSGQPVPGWTMQNKSGHLAWTRPYEQIVMIGDLNGMDLKKQQLITPTQARDAGFNEDLIKQYAKRPSTGVKLVQDDGTEAKKIFSQKGK